MRIGIITFHFVSNEGGVLQCFALKTYLEKQGHDVEIIDYRPPYHTVRYAAVKNPFVYTKWYWKKFHTKKPLRRLVLTAASFVRCIKMNLKKTDKSMTEQFEEFRRTNFKMTRLYTSLKQLKSDPPDLDAYVCGSDQLWNPDLLNQKMDAAYFLEFGREDIPKISFAVSLGKNLSEDELKELKSLCGKLSAVSLREYNALAIEAIGRDVHICIDPTLLLDVDDYLSIEKSIDEVEPYIFVYGFETSEDILLAVESAKREYGCRVINGSPGRVKLKDDVINIRNYAPDAFLSYIKNAECIVTNSFHGTVFSIIYKKSFVTVPHSTRGGRMIELLGKLGISDRLWSSPDFSIDRAIDYDSVSEKLSALRLHSTEYLNEALSGVYGEHIPHYPDELPKKAVGKYEDVHAFYGYYTDQTLIKESSSGGGCNALAEEIIIKYNGLVYGVAYSDDFRSLGYIQVDSLGELKRLKGSKYTFAGASMLDGRNVFNDVATSLASGRYVLVTGLGCFIGALKKYIEKRNIDDTNLYTVDLICHGPTFVKFQNAYIDFLEQKYNSTVIEFSMRYKKKEWTPPYVYAEFSNGKRYIKPFYETDLGFAFKTYSRNSCYSCKFKGRNHVADITAGDFWGMNPMDGDFINLGVTIFLSRTMKGDMLLGGINRNRFYLNKTDVNIAIKNNVNFDHTRRKVLYYDQFNNDFNERGLHYAVKHSPGYRAFLKAALKTRLKRALRL